MTSWLGSCRVVVGFGLFDFSLEFFDASPVITARLHVEYFIGQAAFLRRTG